MTTELELRQIFKSRSDCYADTGRFENDGSYTEGEVIQAMTEDTFIETLKEAKLLPTLTVTKALPEYTEVLYHAKTLTDEQFREYWDDFQKQRLSQL